MSGPLYVSYSRGGGGGEGEEMRIINMALLGDDEFRVLLVYYLCEGSMAYLESF